MALAMRGSIPYSALDSIVSYDRELALDKVQIAEDGKREINNETYYEEY